MEDVGEHRGSPSPPQVRTSFVQASPGRGTLRRQLALSFSLLGTLGTLLCGVLLILVYGVSGSLALVRRDVESTQLALALSLAVREQYIHEAHTILEGNATHLHHHDVWVQRAHAGASELARRVPPSVADDARRVGAMSRELDEVFANEIVPSALAGDDEGVRAAHRRAEALATRSQEESDALVDALDARVSAAHDEAVRASTLAIGLAAAGSLLLAFLGATLFVRLRRSLIAPLRALTLAADRVTRGSQDIRVEAAGRGEVRTVADAFDRMTAQLDERGRQLVRAERMAALGEMAQAVGDSIREPCHAIRARLAELREEPPYGPMRSDLDVLVEEVDACHRIVDDLLTWAQVPSLDRSDVDIAEVVHAAAERFQATEAGRRVELSVDVAPETVSVDAVRFRQVLSNLLRNAAEASPEGARVEVQGRQQRGDGYRLHIRDAGPGIPEDELVKVFEPFYSRRSGGSGLGLAVCHGIVTAHGGRIEARRRPEGGTEILVELPGTPHGAREEVKS